MWTRRKFLLTSILFPPIFLKFVSALWAQAKKILPKGFNREELKNMNPAEIDNRNLDIDPLVKFGTMGPTDVAIDVRTYRLKIKGAVLHPLSLSYDQILKFPSLTETVLLICPGFFANNGRWTGVSFKALLEEAQVKKEAKYLDIKGAYDKTVRISLKEIDRKKIFLAYGVNGQTLPQKHGFPVRLVYEDAYGYDWVKYVEEIIIV
jgi:DMSO/TMAO reductase YedYZ molybdopterin-dependent catalytic subunit